jgi:hypothetical protein
MFANGDLRPQSKSRRPMLANVLLRTRSKIQHIGKFFEEGVLVPGARIAMNLLGRALERTVRRARGRPVGPDARLRSLELLAQFTGSTVSMLERRLHLRFDLDRRID